MLPLWRKTEVCKSSQKCLIKQLMELSDAEQETDTDTDTDEFFYKVEEVSSVQARGKQFYTSLEFCDPDASYKTKLDCQLDTGATCNVLTHCDLSNHISGYQEYQSEATTIQWKCHEAIGRSDTNCQQRRPRTAFPKVSSHRREQQAVTVGRNMRKPRITPN